MKIVILFLIILFTLDVVFRDGHLVLFFFRQDMYLSFFIKILFIFIAIIATLMLLHAIIWDYNLLPQTKKKKTEYEVEKEIEEENISIKLQREYSESELPIKSKTSEDNDLKPSP